MSEVGIIVCFVLITDSCPLPYYKPQGENNALNTVGIISQLLTHQHKVYIPWHTEAMWRQLYWNAIISLQLGKYACDQELKVMLHCMEFLDVFFIYSLCT